ncbi:hypothetical protein Q0Z83_037710 [Actinoplanes sichuanensis]|nr:hypothetical protein Q0Z83_037710 [Actinoplanes sichuanensis]
MAPTILSTQPQTRDDAVRLLMDPHPSRVTVLDGAWWPRSTDVTVELPRLVDALTGLRGTITHVLMSSAEWDLPHSPRVAVDDRSVRIGWYLSQPAGLVTVMTDFGNDRFDLFVVPPNSTPASADATMAAAAAATDRRRAPDLLTDIEYTR